MSTRRTFRTTSVALAVGTAVVAAAALLFPGSAHADRATLRAGLQRAVAVAERNGYTCRNQAKVVNLNPGQAYVLSTTFFRRNSYKLIGVGDDTVRDLD